jgi:hypothetical protein
MENLFIDMGSPQPRNPGEVSLQCPNCKNLGIFRGVGHDYTSSQNANQLFGFRICPNSSCRILVFVILDAHLKVLKTFPPSTIDFDKTRIPERILNAFGEAIICHSQQCYIAAAIMIRKTLEEIAEEKGIKGEKGETLYSRLKKLGEIIVLPKDLIAGMNELRLLGNDAAHIEAKTFEEIGKEEIEISIRFTKEILKATYQYEDLLAQLRSLKKPNVTP